MVWGTIPIGSFVGGVLGNAIGLRPTLWIAGMGSCLPFLSVLLLPVRSLKKIPEPTDEPAVTVETAAIPDVVPPAQRPAP